MPVGTLSIAEQQQVSIAKALAGDAKVLILDEPSAILTDAEIEVLMGFADAAAASLRTAVLLRHLKGQLRALEEEG